jgi:putative transposase
MANLSRKYILFNEDTFHLIWRCHNKSWLLKPNEAKDLYYNLLLKYKDHYDVKVYSYCFMTNHIHLTGKCKTVEGISNLMRTVNSVFGKRINKRLGRCGQVIMDRFKSPVIQTDEDLLNVMRYIDLNPCRSRMVNHPKYYKWSSFAYYAYGKKDPLVTAAPSYLAISETNSVRMALYLDMVESLWIEKSKKRTKNNYSTVLFIGSPDWVITRYCYIKSLKKIRRQAYLDKLKEDCLEKNNFLSSI